MKASAWHALRCLALGVVVALGGVTSTVQAEDADDGRITLACGGIGKDESARMLALQPAHALTLIFAANDGSYLAGVDIRIEAPLEGLSTLRSCGPIGLVDVPARGQYRITASHEGRVLEQWVDLTPAGGARLVLRW